MKTTKVPCAVCGTPIELDEDMLKIKGATFVCSHECLDVDPGDSCIGWSSQQPFSVGSFPDQLGFGKKYD